MSTIDDFTTPTMSDAATPSQAAARLLEIAVTNADELMAETQAEAAALVATAHADADQLTAAAQAAADQLAATSQADADQVTASARTEAEQVVSDAHAEAQRVRQELARFTTEQTAELEQHRESELSDVTARKASLESAVRQLEQVERAYEQRMRTFLAEQMEQLDALGRFEETSLGSVPDHSASDDHDTDHHDAA